MQIVLTNLIINYMGFNYFTDYKLYFVLNSKFVFALVYLLCEYEAFLDLMLLSHLLYLLIV